VTLTCVCGGFRRGWGGCGTQSVLWMKLCAGMLVELLGVIGAVVGMSPAFLGATVLAWGSSVADLAANAAVARKNPKMVLPPTPYASALGRGCTAHDHRLFFGRGG
jgi:hypothetical protein